jgi:drug/metabolite transporter (DMT)-like permease
MMSKQTLPAATLLAAGLYILSGVSQPLLMTVAAKVGVADPRAQLYMLFYYAGPASVGLTLRRRRPQTSATGDDKHGSRTEDERYWPSTPTILRAASIAVLDVFAQSLNYAGNNLSGPTIFAVIYSSVTIWAAVYSRCFLGRDLNCTQWIGVASVFVGLALTAFHSVSIGRNVFLGACLVAIGSSLHALVYVISEKLMTHGEEKITVRANCAVQGFVALVCFSAWEVLYTLPRFEDLIAGPVRAAGSTWIDVTLVLCSIGFANLVHGFSFFITLKNFPGGSVSAGVMKGLQAVLVFVFTSLVFCGLPGTGEEMCFDTLKLVSLIVVVGGILIYGWETDRRHRQGEDEDLGLASSIHFASAAKNGTYERIPEV